MKKLIVLISAMLVLAPLTALDINPATMTAEGEWEIQGERLVQVQPGAPRAKIAIPYPQNGVAEYEFTVRYEDGVLEDGHGGFGIHIFADNVKYDRAWGVDDSWLLWINYDVEPVGISSGLSAQVYKSVSNSRMDLVADYDMNWALDNMEKIGLGMNDLFGGIVPIRFTVDSQSGEVIFDDPFSQDYVYKFTLPIEQPLEGSMVVLRSNGMALSFGQ